MSLSQKISAAEGLKWKNEGDDKIGIPKKKDGTRQTISENLRAFSRSQTELSLKQTLRSTDEFATVLQSAVAVDFVSPVYYLIGGPRKRLEDEMCTCRKEDTRLLGTRYSTSECSIHESFSRGSD